MSSFITLPSFPVAGTYFRSIAFRLAMLRTAGVARTFSFELLIAALSLVRPTIPVSSDEDDEDDDSYPDVGIFLDSPNRIEIGNVEAIYDPGPAGFEIKTLLTLDPKDPLVLEKLEAAIEYAARVSKAEMQVCMYCKEKLPSYSMSEDGYCYGCGSSELGIIY